MDKDSFVSMWAAALFGGLGGSVRGFLAIYHLIGTWQQLRRRDLVACQGGSRKRLADSLDWPAESIAMASQIVLGAVAGLILSETHTVTGVAGAILAGAAAPAILGQLGQLRSVHDVVSGEPETKQARTSGDTISEGVSGRTLTRDVDADPTVVVGVNVTRPDGEEVE